MSFRVIWFVLAGFVLGFTTSTIWEWLYYRQRRRRLLEQDQQSVLAAQRSSPARPTRNTNAQTTQTDRESVTAARPRSVRSTDKAADPDWQLPPYRSSGIFLESEQTDSAQSRFTDRDLSSTSTASTRPPTIAAPSSATQFSVHRNDTTTTVDSQLSTKPENWANRLNEPAAATGSSSAQATTANAQVNHTQAHTIQSTAGHVDKALAGNTTKRAPDHPDNLANIKGIGEAYKRRLYATGIYTWRKLAESDTETLRRITRAKPNADIQSWQRQARELAETEGRWNANFQGPLDDFTRIEGIGAITADILYRFGICTYEQLAATNPDELARIVPAPTVGNENDFDGWIRGAAQLAQAKARNGGNLL